MFDYISSFDNFNEDVDDDATVESSIEDEIGEVDDEIVMGKVTCELLNIRPKPKMDDVDNKPLTTVKKDTELLLMGGFEDHHNWYSVCTPSGVEGYAMKKFISIS